MKETEALEILNRIESIKNFVGHTEEMDIFLQKVADIEGFFIRFESLETLINHMRMLEKQIYTLKEFFSIEEVAKYLNLSKSQVYKLTSAKEITTYKPNGKTVFIKRADLNEWICRNRILSNYEIELEAELQAKRWETEHPNKFVNRKG